jgi:ATP-dependent helicase/nuclease subunit A
VARDRPGAAADPQQHRRKARGRAGRGRLGGTPDARLTPYLKVFFTEKGAPRADKDLATRSFDPAIRARLEAERDRLALLKDKLASAEAVERTEALFRLAGAIRAKVDSTKARLGALDFDDLIRKTLELLERDSAAWVLYKLDRGIDHVLVDEAQDTNPDQWRILRHLTEDFTAGEGRPVRGPRTLFAVGDPKQSIFSFQGADPRWFEESRRHWRGRTEGAQLRFEDVRLDLSFRSAPAILKAVDFTFSIEAHFRGLTFGDDVRTSHGSARPAAPGHVEIWPTQRKSDPAREPDAWTIPVDEPDRKAPAILTAERVARAVRHWMRAGDETGRVWRPGDILILVRKRGPAFFAAIRALKSSGIPVAGADRFDIGEQIAVNDLVAAGAAALLPSNDLVLAAALKSPLVGLDDDDLIRIAADRGSDESLVDALTRTAEAGDARAAAALEAVSEWRGLARESGPFGFYAALLGPGGGRKRLVERLGGEAADAIDAFLCYAQTAETGPEAPSLTTFLARFESAEHTIKRDLDAAGHEVKVMTVHGAKGLEAPIVILLDGCDIGGREPSFVPVQTAGNAGPVPVWSPGAATDSRRLAAAREAAKQLRLEEHNRLLYVAMTRARDRLVIAPFTSDREPEEALVQHGPTRFADAAETLTEVDVGYGPTLVWSDGSGAEPPARTAARLSTAPRRAGLAAPPRVAGPRARATASPLRRARSRRADAGAFALPVGRHGRAASRHPRPCHHRPRGRPSGRRARERRAGVSSVAGPRGSLPRSAMPSSLT